MIKNRFQGDPALFMDEDGSYLLFKGGQPVMDQGIENTVKISLFTRPGWWGNVLFKKDSEKLGSDYEEKLSKPIVNISSVSDVEKSAENALAWMKAVRLADKIESDAVNTSGNRIDNVIKISPVGKDVQTFLVTENSINWINQARFPAHGEL